MVRFSHAAARYGIIYSQLYLLLSVYISTHQSEKSLAFAHAVPQNHDSSTVSGDQIENAVKSNVDDGIFLDEFTNDTPETLPDGEREHMRIMQGIYNRLTDIENENKNEIALADVDVHALRQEVILPELEHRTSPESEVHGMIRALRNTEQFRRAYRDLDDERLKNEIKTIVGDTDGISGVSDGLSSLDLDDVPAHDRREEAATPEDATIFGRRLKSSELPRRDTPVEKDPTLLCEDENCNENVEVYINQLFENWSETISNYPQLTFVPKTVLGIQNVVRYAASNDKRVRCSGYRLSWNPIFSEDGEILISLIEPKKASAVPNTAYLTKAPDYGPEGPELKRIELLSEQTAQGNGLCRIGASVTNEELRRWFLDNGNWALPVNPVIADGTVVGSASTMSHGAGREHKTLADNVRRVEYVDCNGELHVVDDPQDINAIVGSMGLFGVITHITHEVIPMQYAVLEPRKIDVALAIPPLDKDEIPEPLRQEWLQSADADARISAAVTEFERRAANDFYCEWIWFPYQQRVWTHTWNPTTDATEATKYPNNFEVLRQWLENWAGNALTASPLLSGLPDRWEAEIIGKTGMTTLPPFGRPDREPTIVTALPDALHYRRGLSNMPLHNLELEIPLPPRADNPSEPDFSVARRAWWDVIKLVYAYTDSVPLRVFLEMRIIGGSDALLAPQRGNDLGTVAIGIGSTINADRDGQWLEFCQRVVDAWSASSPDLAGGYSNVRPHWAKVWTGLRMQGQPIEEYVRDVAFADQIRDFKGAMADIGRRHNYSVEDAQARLSNPLWDRIIF